MATPMFGFSNKRVGTLVVLSDGSVLELIEGQWRETAPLPRTARAAQLPEVPRAD